VVPRGFNDPRNFLATDWVNGGGDVIAQVIQLQQLVRYAKCALYRRD
jgi:hypothetical protein